MNNKNTPPVANVLTATEDVEERIKERNVDVYNEIMDYLKAVY